MVKKEGRKERKKENNDTKEKNSEIQRRGSTLSQTVIVKVSPFDVSSGCDVSHGCTNIYKGIINLIID